MIGIYLYVGNLGGSEVPGDFLLLLYSWFGPGEEMSMEDRWTGEQVSR